MANYVVNRLILGETVVAFWFPVLKCDYELPMDWVNNFHKKTAA